MSAFLITGRSLENFRAKGDAVPSGSVTVACMACGASLAISAEGALKLEEAKAAGHSPAGAVCTPCVLALPHFDEIRASKAGAELVERSENAKLIVGELLKRTRKL